MLHFVGPLLVGVRIAYDLLAISKSDNDAISRNVDLLDNKHNHLIIWVKNVVTFSVLNLELCPKTCWALSPDVFAGINVTSPATAEMRRHKNQLHNNFKVTSTFYLPVKTAGCFPSHSGCTLVDLIHFFPHNVTWRFLIDSRCVVFRYSILVTSTLC